MVRGWDMYKKRQVSGIDHTCSRSFQAEGAEWAGGS